MAQVPSAQHPVWKKLLSQASSGVKLDLLAANFFLVRAKRALGKDPSELDKLAGELQQIYQKNGHLDTAQKDLATMLRL